MYGIHNIHIHEYVYVYVNIYIYIYIHRLYKSIVAQKIDGFTAVSIASKKRTHSILITMLSVSKYISR